MFKSIGKFFSSPVFENDQEKTTMARILFLIMKFYSCLALFILIGDVFLFIRKLEILQLVLLFIIVLVIAFSFARKGKIHLAGFLIIIFLWCLYTPVIWFSGGVKSLFVVSYLTISILAGILFGRKVTICVALLSSFTLLGMFLLESYGINPPKYFPIPIKSILFIWFSAFIVVVPVINLAFQILGESHVANKKEIEERKLVESALRESETLLIAAKDKAEEINRLKSAILNNMSHELRTPLIAIMGFADILESEINDPALKNMLSMISQGGKRLSETLNLILDLSKMESENLSIVTQPINLSELTRNITAAYEGAAKAKDITFKTVITENLVINTDERIYSQILDNLMNNAVKFTNTGGISVFLDKEIKSMVGEEKYFVVLKVVDTGIGLAPEDFNLIFEEFRQVSAGLSRSFQGTGLGLTITKRFVELLGGEITVESELKKGSTFKVILPA